MRRPGPDDLGEGADADAHELAAFALLGLLLAQPGVVDHVHGLLERRGVVARVVLPAGRRLVRELVLADEVLHAQLGRVLADVVGEDVDHPLDRVDGLGHPERAAIGDAAGRLVRVDAIDFDERVVEVVRAGDDVEQAGRELGRVRGGIGVAVVGDRLDLEPGDLAFLGRAHLRVDVIVAGERVRLEVLAPALDPLDRLAGQERRGNGQDVARVYRHFAPEATADVVRLDPDVLLVDGKAGATGNEGEHRPDGVRRLAGHVQRELLADRVPISDAAARLDRRDMDARDVDVLLDASPRRPRARRPRLAAVTRFPVPDVVVRPSPGHGRAGGRTHRVRAPCAGRR